jgi:flotillin
MIEYDLNLARIKIIPDALAQAVKPVEKISEIKIFDTGSLLGRGAAGGGIGGGQGLGLGDGLAAQLLSVSAFKPMIDKILTEAGFAAGPDAITSLTNALARKQDEAASAAPAASDDTIEREPGSTGPSSTRRKT